MSLLHEIYPATAAKDLGLVTEVVGDPVLEAHTMDLCEQLAAKDVAATEAGTFLGGKGVDIGLADAVAAPDAAFRALLKQLD